MTGLAPHLRFLVPPNSENRWTDLLATLIKTDTAPIARFIGAEPDEVLREVGLTRADRLDLLLMRDGAQLAAIEVKLLSDLATRQLVRYREAFAEAASHLVLHLAVLPVDHRSAPGWSSLTWEEVLEAYSNSRHPWVATTARAWLALLPELLPQIDENTVWNDVPDTAGPFELDLRAKVAWLAGQVDRWCTIDNYLSMSSGGGAWAVTMRTPASAPGHWALAELQEGLDAREWRPDPRRPYRDRVHGPTVLVGLSQDPTDTSETFDWSLLRRVFTEDVIGSHPWMTTAARPGHPIDRANQQAIVADGAPAWLGKGYGMATTKTHHVCAFGARLRFPPTITLGELDAEFRSLQRLVIELAGVV